MKGFSVIMPTYNQSAYIHRAVLSLLKQSFEEWELIIINDGCSDSTDEIIAGFLCNNKIVYIKNEINKGLGYAINRGLNRAKYDYIAYLPSDDFYYENHLELLMALFDEKSNITLAVSGIKFNDNDSFFEENYYFTQKLIAGRTLQLVQAAHAKTDDRWMERKEGVCEDLYELFWHKLMDKGEIGFTNQISCSWTNHPHQRHKIISEKRGGGLNYYRNYYQIKEPIKLKVSDDNIVDENELYSSFRKPVKHSKDKLKILLVGELSFNSERIYALEEAGHQLYGLWCNHPMISLYTVGPLPFGHVIDIPYSSWKEKVNEIKPDIIYALLNTDAIPLAHEVLTSNLQIPFIWHFKEGSSSANKFGVWKQLIDLYSFSDGQIYICPEAKEYYEQFIPHKKGESFILDGDLPKIDYFTDNFSPRLSVSDKELHTVAPGRVVGISFEELRIMAKQKIHLHLYIQTYKFSRENFIQMAFQAMGERFHLHTPCNAKEWVSEFSQYDAGWLHCFQSENENQILRMGWNDLNIPARMNTLAAAGLPILQRDNQGHIVATQNRVKELDIGICFDNYENLGQYLRDEERMNTLRKNLLKHRAKFSFDYHVPELINFFRKVIDNKKKENGD